MHRYKPRPIGVATLVDMRIIQFGGPAVFALLAPSLMAQVPDSTLLGWWTGQIIMPGATRRSMVLEQHETGWRASIGAARASAVAGRTATLAFDDSLGQVRLAVGPDGRVAAFWIQPAAAGPPYATPVALRAGGPQRWTGVIEPLRQTFTLFLNISADSTGRLRGVFRNHEANWNGRSEYRVERHLDTVRFLDVATGRVRWTQPYDTVARRIRFDFGQTLDLAPADPSWLARIAPSKRAAVYQYRRPIVRPDGWRVERASSVGIRESGLAAIIQRIDRADPAAHRSPRLHSVLVARRGRLVMDEYFHGFGPDDLHDLRSASKTITSILAGIAMGHDRWSAESAAWPLAGDSSGDAAHRAITVGHLLSHGAGLDCDDDDPGTTGHEDRMQNQRAEPDWYRFVLGLPVVEPPGRRYRYCSAGVHLVGGIVARRAGTWLPAYFDKALARPLGIARYAINLTPTGEGYGAGGWYLTPRDLLKVGQLYLDGGRWRGRRVVPAAWVTASTAARIGRPDGGADSWGWHRHQVTVDDRRFPTFEASGNGGQLVIVVPDLELVVASTAGNYGEGPVWTRFRERELVEVIRAVTK